MDRKTLIIIVASLLVLFGVMTGVDRLYPPVPRKATVATNSLANRTNVTAVPSSNAAPITSAATTSAAMIKPAGPEQTLVVSNKEILLHFTSHGGGLKLIELKNHKAAISCGREHAAETNLASLNTSALTPVLALLGGEQLEGDNNYTLSQNGNTIRAEKNLPNGLRIVKEFQLSTNQYLLSAKVRLENTSSSPVALPAQQVVVGTASAQGPTDDPTTIGSLWYNGSKLEDIKDVWFQNPSFGCACAPSNPRYHYLGGANNVVWAAVQSQFFTLATIPATNAPQIAIDKIHVPAPIGSVAASPLTNAYQAALVYPSAVLEPGKSVEHEYTIYAGPKEYKGLAQIGQQMNNNLDLLMNFGTFGFFSKLLLLSMNGLHAVGLHYALAIIAITIILKLLFWPLTNASTKSMKRMQLLQPQMKAIADKYKDDPVKKNQKTMEFMKEHKVNPLGGCLPMLLQIPVFIGFYYMLRSAIELRGVSFLWACDLSQPDTIGYLGGFPINPLPLLMGATMVWQTGLTPPSPGMDPSQQKIMRWGLPIMMIFVLYKVSAGLTLYWTVQNLLTIAQTKLTKTTDVTVGSGGKAGPGAPVKKK